MRKKKSIPFLDCLMSSFLYHCDINGISKDCFTHCAILFTLFQRGSALETQRVSDFFPLNFAQKRAEKKNARDYPLRKKFKFISIRRLRAPRLPPPGAGRRRTRVVTVGAGAGEATDRSRRRRARATFQSYHLGRHLGRLAGC